jgi:predicted DsbA family dithiol-disulfide isomerase
MTDAASHERPTVTVDVVSDVCCPWCYLGKRRLDRAIEQMPDVDVVVSWRPYQLDPTIPAEGVDRAAYMKEKFGDLSRVDEIHGRLSTLGAAEGIDYDFDAIKVSSNSLDAHRLIRWAAEEGLQNEMKERLLAAFWTEGENIGDADVLVEAATAVGLDGEKVRARLATDEDREAVTAEIAHFQRMGVRGVPTFILERKYAISGAQEVETLVEALRDVAEEKAFGEKM